MTAKEDVVAFANKLGMRLPETQLDDYATLLNRTKEALAFVMEAEGIVQSPSDKTGHLTVEPQTTSPSKILRIRHESKSTSLQPQRTRTTHGHTAFAASIPIQLRRCSRIEQSA